MVRKLLFGKSGQGEYAAVTLLPIIGLMALTPLFTSTNIKSRVDREIASLEGYYTTEIGAWISQIQRSSHVEFPPEFPLNVSNNYVMGMTPYPTCTALTESPGVTDVDCLNPELPTHCKLRDTCSSDSASTLIRRMNNDTQSYLSIGTRPTVNRSYCGQSALAGSSLIYKTCLVKGCSWLSMTNSEAPAARTGQTSIWTADTGDAQTKNRMVLWGGRLGTNAYATDGGIYDPQTDSWASGSSSMQAAPISGRAFHTAVWTGVTSFSTTSNRMIVWGGVGQPSCVGCDSPLGTGGIYSIEKNDWSTISTLNAPTPRFDHVAVWTGEEMIIWGGCFSSPNPYVECAPLGALGDGARYNPRTNSWVPISVAPQVRAKARGVWTGTKMLIFGGHPGGSGNYYEGGLAYDLASNTWSTMTDVSSPQGRIHHSTLWTLRNLVAWGGADENYNLLNSGGEFDLNANQWDALPVTSVAPRKDHSTVWTGHAMMVWGGCVGNPTCTSLTDDGGAYNPKTNQWIRLSPVKAPAPRNNHSAIWTGDTLNPYSEDQMIVWGGEKSGNTLTLGNGGRYQCTPPVKCRITATPAVLPSGGGLVELVAVSVGGATSSMEWWDGGGILINDQSAQDLDSDLNEIEIRRNITVSQNGQFHAWAIGPSGENSCSIQIALPPNPCDSNLQKGGRISFDELPNGLVPTDLKPISNEFKQSHGVTFCKDRTNGVTTTPNGKCDAIDPPAMLAKVGSPKTAFSGVSGDDTPTTGQNVGQFFLVDDGDYSSSTQAPIIMRYETAVDAASGVIIDIDEMSGSTPVDTWNIYAQAADGTVLDSIYIDPTYPKTGNGIATPWFFKRASKDIHSIWFVSGHSGYAIDNISPEGICNPPTTAEPSGLSAQRVSSSQVNLSWNDNSTNENGFFIERSTDGIKFSSIKGLGPNVTSYSNTGLSGSSSYYYRVFSYNSSGRSYYSNVAMAPPW